MQLNENKKDLILVVDDQITNLKVISSVFEDQFSLSLADSGMKALKILEKRKPQLILLDIMMPEMDGFEVCRKIKANSKTKDIPIIFLTAKSDIEDIVEGFDIGAVDFITKPFNIKELNVRIQTHLNLYHAKQKIVLQKEEIEKYNEQLLKTEKELSKQNQEKDKFFSIIAHDLNSPFQGLLGYVEMLNENYDELDDERRKKMLKTLQDSAVRVHNLLINLLEWSRSKRGKIEYKPEPVHLNSLVQDVSVLFSNQCNKKGLVIEIEIPQDLQMLADKNMLHTILRNLISNAVKFSDKGDSITVSAGQSDEKVEVSVSDTGIGIEKRNIEKLFKLDTSFSTPGTKNETGTGLGLNLCKEFVEKHNGCIWVESEKGKGSTFTFSIPLVRQS